MVQFSPEKTYALFQNGANRKTISELAATGAKTLLFPALETRESQDLKSENLSELIKNFSWLIFTDIYAVEFFLQKLEAENFDFFSLDEIRVCAYGESVADRLRFARLHADIIPNNVKTETVWQTIQEYFIDEEDLKEERFLIFKEKNSQTPISEKLAKIGATVSELAIYEISRKEDAEIAKLKSLLRGGAIDEFIFTSPLDIINLAHLFPNENLEEVLTETKLSASDKVTGQSIEEFRIR